MSRNAGSIILAILALAAGCSTTSTPLRPSTADLAGVRRLAIILEGGGGFEVVEKRATGASVSAEVLKGAFQGAGQAGPYGILALPAFLAIAGLVYAGETAWKAYGDAQVGEAIAPGVAPRTLVLEALTTALRSSGRFDVEVIDTDRDALDRRSDGVILLRFPRWGFILLPSEGKESLVAFIQVHARMMVGGKSTWDDEDTVFGHGRYSSDDLKARPDLARQAVVDTLETAANRLAGELLYPRGGPR